MKSFSYLCLIGLVVSGCSCTPETPSTDDPRTPAVSCVVIGMETSQRFGSCPGCEKDSSLMAKLFRDAYGYPVTLLQSEQATRVNVILAIQDAIRKTPEDGLFILYYSGHGGQELLNAYNTEEPEGADKEDEYLCLYDTYLLDNEIWQLITRCKGRVFCCFDACHSKTMFRSVLPEFCLRQGWGQPMGISNVRSRGGFNLKPMAIPLGNGSFRMLCWGGCQEAEYSYGSTFGGVMTNKILNNWKKDRTYRQVWDLVVQAVTAERPTQHPAATQYGSGFDLVFR